ncbi:MAG: TolC family protein [Bacteroidales bacterium]
MCRSACLSIILCLIFITVQAQDSIRTEKNKLLIDFELPSLEVLYNASSQNNPVVGFYRSRKIEEESDLKSTKRRWLNYIRITGGYQYGQLWSDNSSIDATQGGGSVIQRANNNQSYYNVGLSVIMPLEEIIDRSNKIKSQKERIEQTQFEVKRYLDEQKLLIVHSYTIAEKWMTLLKVRAEALRYAEAQFKLSREAFVQNKIDASDLSRMKNMHSDALGDFVIAQTELKEAILRLEILTGYKILNQ